MIRKSTVRGILSAESDTKRLQSGDISQKSFQRTAEVIYTPSRVAGTCLTEVLQIEQVSFSVAIYTRSQFWQAYSDDCVVSVVTVDF